MRLIFWFILTLVAISMTVLVYKGQTFFCHFSQNLLEKQQE